MVSTEHHDQRRQQATGTTAPEADEVGAAPPVTLGQQECRDQEARDDEEQVDAEPSPGEGRAGPVEDHHGDDGDGAQAVQSGTVGQ
jgi:hypothetical protein